MKEKCGLFAAFSTSKTDVIPLVTIGLRGLQHRGQEAWGIATPTMNPFKQNGLVTDNLDQSALVLQQMKTNIAIGHVRYSTAGGTSLSNAQPFSINKKFLEIPFNVTSWIDFIQCCKWLCCNAFCVNFLKKLEICSIGY